MIFSAGVPKFVEYNIDSSLGGGFDADTVIQRYEGLYREHGILDDLPVRAAPSLLDQRFVAIREELRLPEGARVALLMDFDADYPGLDDPQTFIRILDPLAVRARDFGIDLVIAPVATATVDADNRLVVDGAPVDALFRLFVPNRVTADRRSGRGGSGARRRHPADVRVGGGLAARQQDHVRAGCGRTWTGCPPTTRR